MTNRTIQEHNHGSEMSNIRILNSLTDPRVGGPQVRALGIAKRLRKRDIEDSVPPAGGH